MCGRYAIYGPQSRYRDQFGVSGFEFVARYNAAPSQWLPVIRRQDDGTRIALLARWGLLPSWVKDPAALTQPINAKAETVAIKPMFRHAFRKGRILVPAVGFYEWKLVAGRKQPYFVRMRDQSPFGMAGLFEHWAGPEGEVLTFAILTTTPNALMSEIHDRMPAIVQPADYAAWLNPEMTDVEALQGMLKPYPERLMEAYPVSREVNSPGNDGAALVEPIGEGLDD